MKKVILLGCGKVRARNIRLPGDPEDFLNDDVVSIDLDPSSKPDILMDLRDLYNGGKLPFKDESIDEIHAYDILEHIGNLGDWKGFFDEFAEYHRILKNNGKFYILVPVGNDAFADIGHSRFFHQNHFFFLNQKFNKREQDPGTTTTDYSWYWKKNFEIDHIENVNNHHLAVVLKKHEIT